ncbi:MAG: hypothetical protein ACFFDN_28265 [Candidatus Hodarchaeota archaeon]
MNKESSKTRLILLIFLLIITWVVTIWLLFQLTNLQTRSETFGFTLIIICFLEFLFYGYLSILFIPYFRKGIVWALYPIIGVIVGFYIAISLIIIIGYNLFSLFFSLPKAYLVILTIETLIFLIILGSIIFLNMYKKVEDIGIEKERKRLTNISVAVIEIYQEFMNCKKFLDIQSYRSIEKKIRKLKERFQVCTPFGRSNPGIEEKIQNKVANLSKLVGEISSAPKEEISNKTENIKNLTIATLQELERREKFFIK